MHTLQQITLLVSLSVRLLFGALETTWAQTKHGTSSTHSHTKSTAPNGLTFTNSTGAHSWTTAMGDTVECETDEATDRVHLGVCDRHPSALAGALWVNYTLALSLALCGHCDRRHLNTLSEQGFERARFNMPAYRQGAPA